MSASELALYGDELISACTKVTPSSLTNDLPNVTIEYAYTGEATDKKDISTGVTRKFCDFKLFFSNNGPLLDSTIFNSVIISQPTSNRDEFTIEICSSKIRTILINPLIGSMYRVPEDGCTLKINIINHTSNIVLVNITFSPEAVASNRLNANDLKANVCAQSRTTFNNILRFNDSTTIQTNKQVDRPVSDQCGEYAYYSTEYTSVDGVINIQPYPQPSV